MMSTIAWVVKAILPDSTSQHSAGVRKTPRMLEAEALTTAPATLPRAIEVKAIEDCTVEGTSVR